MTLPIVVIANQVVALTDFVASDVNELVTYDSDPELAKRFDIPKDFVPNREHSLQVILRWRQQTESKISYTFAVRAIDSNSLVGGCELRPGGKGWGDISFWTYPPHRRQGYAREAVNLLCKWAGQTGKAEQIQALVEPDNFGSQATCTANGFHRDIVVPDIQLAPDGQKRDMLRYTKLLG